MMNLIGIWNEYRSFISPGNWTLLITVIIVVPVVIILNAASFIRFVIDIKEKRNMKRRSEKTRKRVKAKIDFKKTVDLARRKQHIITAHSSIIGTRLKQQDALYVDDSATFSRQQNCKLIGILCDGMGGMDAGERASSMAVHLLKSAFQKNQNISNIPEFLEQTINELNEDVYKIRNDYNEIGRAGTTLVAVVIQNRKMYWASVGDSRIYIFRKGKILQLTRDHNYLLRLLKNIKEPRKKEEVILEPHIDALISYVGMKYIEILDVSKNFFELQNEDIVLLCSDGLNKSLSDAQIADIIVNNMGNLVETARLLPLSAFNKNVYYQDNTSVILMQYFD